MLDAIVPDTSMTRLSEDDLAALLETFPHGLLLCDTNATIVVANRAARDLLGLAAARSGGVRLPLSAAGPAGSALAWAVAEAAGDRRAPAWRTRVSTRDRGTLRVLAQCTGPEHVALLVRRESAPETDVHRVLVTQLRLAGRCARLAGCVYRGWSNQEIADALQIPLGRVKWRLAQVFRQVGVRRRSALVLAVDRALAGSQAASPRGPAGAATEPPHGQVAPLPRCEPRFLLSLRKFLEGVDIGLAAAAGGGQVRWANPEAQRWVFARLRPAAPGEAKALAFLKAAARVAATERGPTQTLWLELSGDFVHATLWHAGAGLAGIQFHRERLRAADVETLLRERFRLSPRQIQVALLIARDHSNREIARALKIREGTIRSGSTTIYAKLGVHNRLDLVALLDELGAAPTPPE
ncbi:MAG: PAS domain-containing protein [Deltaproteobacteria bacterium]|nr:PAS domain-containing protein [Deltaproteobacteria bacterium]